MATYSVVIENHNISSTDELQAIYNVRYVDDIAELIKKEDPNHCTIESEDWGEAYLGLGENDGYVWASARYFPFSDEHGNGGEIPQDAQDIILRIEEVFNSQD